jgi:hypothetical protein
MRLGQLRTLLTLIVLFWGSVAQAQTQTDQTQVKTDLTEGFILLGDVQVPAGFKTKAVYTNQLWTTDAIPYEFDPNVTLAHQTAMIAAMAAWESTTDVGFRPCPGNACSGNYVHIQNSTGNNSAEGMVGGKQIINIFNWDNTFIMAHELGHCLGLHHEHTRADRDIFVHINTENIQPGGTPPYADQFALNMFAPTYGNYDFDSVMHYGKCDFSIDCPAGSSCNCTHLTITVLPPNDTQWQNAIGQRTHLSAGDIAVISFLYPQRFLDCNYNGNNGPPNGRFLSPYTSFATAVSGTPEGGTLWIENTCFFPAVGSYSKQLTIKVAPGVIATLGD